MAEARQRKPRKATKIQGNRNIIPVLSLDFSLLFLQQAGFAFFSLTLPLYLLEKRRRTGFSPFPSSSLLNKREDNGGVRRPERDSPRLVLPLLDPSQLA
jgi:hypothetical protein